MSWSENIRAECSKCKELVSLYDCLEIMVGSDCDICGPHMSIEFSCSECLKTIKLREDG